MIHLRLLLLFVAVFICQSVNAQKKTIHLNQADPRFTFTAERYFDGQGAEMYYFFVKNNTNLEYEVVIDVTVYTYCHGEKNTRIGENDPINLKPGEKQGPAAGYSLLLMWGKHEDCRAKDGNSYTYFKSMTYRFASVKNITEEKQKAEQAKQAKQQEKIDSEKKAASATANPSAPANNGQHSTARNNTTVDNSEDFWGNNAQQQPNRGETTRHQPAQPEKTPEQVGAEVNKMFADAKAKNDAIEAQMMYKADLIAQNFYIAEAIRTGKRNLAELSTLDGNYSSIQELEAEFNRKLNAIRSEVDGLEQSRNAAVTNSVNATIDPNSAEQVALGEGAKLLGSIVNNAKANKEEREAAEALRLEREKRRKALEEAKRQARLNLRNQLVTTFPDGGTPITSHKVTAPEVYIFAYIADKGAFDNEYAAVAVSNVFPVQAYSDGTFPYKTTVLNKIKSNGTGQVTLVGFYLDKRKAEDMRNSFLNLAYKSSLHIKEFVVKTTTSKTNTSVSNGDFWETGTTPEPAKKPAEKKDDFWNN